MIPYFEYLQKKYHHVSIKLRSKPHQSSSILHDQNFPQLNSQRTIASDILWSDSVVSAMSTVSISSSFLKIPSFFYNPRLNETHAKLVNGYLDSVMWLSLMRTNSSAFSKYISKYSKWPSISTHTRKKLCLDYSRRVTNKFYNFVDSIL